MKSLIILIAILLSGDIQKLSPDNLYINESGKYREFLRFYPDKRKVLILTAEKEAIADSAWYLAKISNFLKIEKLKDGVDEASYILAKDSLRFEQAGDGISRLFRGKIVPAGIRFSTRYTANIPGEVLEFKKVSLKRFRIL